MKQDELDRIVANAKTVADLAPVAEQVIGVLAKGLAGGITLVKGAIGKGKSVRPTKKKG